MMQVMQICYAIATAGEVGYYSYIYRYTTCTVHVLFKRVLNPNFRPFSFGLNKNRFFKINFDLGFIIL